MWIVLTVLFYVGAVVAALAATLDYFYRRLRLNSRSRRNPTQKYIESHSIARYYFCALMQAVYMSPGIFYPSIPSDKLTYVDPDSPEGRQGVTGKFVPSKDERVNTKECYMRFKELDMYKKVIGYSGDPSKVPPLWMSSYFNKAILSLGSSEFSRARILGMVHLRQRVTVYHDLSPLMRGHFSVTFLNEEHKMTRRGLEITARTSVWGPNDILLWEGLISGLSVLPRRDKPKKPPPEKDTFSVYREEEVHAATNTGLLIAQSTEDYQPQHLTWWTAKLVGFRSPIAHGLWSMAVAVDRIMRKERASFEDRYPLHIDVHFKRPLTLPGTALLQYDKPRETSQLTNFRIVKPNSLAPILIGTQGATMLCTLLYVALSLLGMGAMLEILYRLLRINFKTPKQQTMAELEPQSLPGFYYCAVMQALRMSPGRFYPALPGEKMSEPSPNSPAVFYPPKSEKMVATECSMRHDRLEMYRKSIGYSGDPKQLPPIFMSSYFNKALIAIGSSLFSRIRILGVVHLQQQVTVYRDLRSLLHEQFSATLISEEYRQTPKGVQCLVRAGIYDSNDILVWEALVTGLSLGPKRKSSTAPQKQPEEFTVYKQEEITAPVTTGIDFARATQDYQPQHLNKWTAKLVGFSRPIAHGLWSMAVAVDRIMASEQSTFADRYPLHMDVSFKRPLVLPGKALLQFDQPSGTTSATNFRMLNSRDNSPILVGRMHVGDS
ncbi:hypothetical protein EGW08_018880 [Elysia chlorotica]|uniref:MaoC-like domain-containing protein n=1 Tax=Elysia chlorotica TaxID=188477 RepID=A0A3S1H6R4_ELYCH|nr:hypothetical protein EGW08_018880 [Elysia chlorotica]